MKLIQIVSAHNTIDGLAEKENIGVHLAYVMTKFIVATQADADFYAREMRKLFEKYGNKNDKGEITIPHEKVEEFSKEARILQETEATDPGIRFSLSEMSQELKLSMKQIYPLMDFIKDDKGE